MATVRTAAAAALALLLLAGVSVLAGLAAVLVEGPPADQLFVVDTDAGADDAFALMELLRAEELLVADEWTRPPHRVPRLLAVTCVMGNAPVHNVTKNVLATLGAANRLDVPVYVGAEVPLMPPPAVFTDYFGLDGFGDFLPPGPPPGEPQREHAAVALVRLAKENPGSLTLLCIGPLTNIALAVRLDPGFLANLKDVFILGGAAHGIGNAAPGAEFNMWTDPDAAAVVLDAVPAGKPAYLLPWETVLDTEVTMKWRREVLGASNSSTMAFLNAAERVVLEGGSSTWESGDGLMAAYLVDGRVAAPAKAVRVSVLPGAAAGKGVTLADHSNTTGLPANVVLVENPDTSAFQRTLLRLLASS